MSRTIEAANDKREDLQVALGALKTFEAEFEPAAAFLRNLEEQRAELKERKRCRDEAQRHFRHTPERRNKKALEQEEARYSEQAAKVAELEATEDDHRQKVNELVSKYEALSEQYRQALAGYRQAVLTALYQDFDEALEQINGVWKQMIAVDLGLDVASIGFTVRRSLLIHPNPKREEANVLANPIYRERREGRSAVNAFHEIRKDEESKALEEALSEIRTATTVLERYEREVQSLDFPKDAA